MSDDYGRIHRVAFKVVTSVFFTTAMIAVIGRLVIRFKYQKKLFADDYVLLFGWLSLIASFTLVNVVLEDIYFDMSLILGPPDLVLHEITSPNFGHRILIGSQLAVSAEVLNWVSILSVKMSYLLFFRLMVDRLKAIYTYWVVTMVIVGISGCFWISSVFIACQHFGVAAFECVQKTGFRRSIIITIVSNSLDMITDLLIVAVPIMLIWKIKIRLYQKFVLGTFLCLSLCMFVVCLIRTIGEAIHGNAGSIIDVQWNTFWHTIEACVAVTVVSLTAFRSLYTIQERRRQEKRNADGPLQYYRNKMLHRKQQRRVDEFGDSISDKQGSLPYIPRATLTGMRTIIDGKSRVTTQSSTLLEHVDSDREA